MRTLWNDARWALRGFARAKGFLTLAVLTLALGIGASTAIYSVADALLFRPLPAGDPGRLFAVSRGNGASEPASWPEYVDYRDRSQGFTGLTAYVPLAMSFGGRNGNELLLGEVVTGSYFDTLGLRPALGRLVGRQDDTPGATPVVVVSHGLWARQLAADPDVMGLTVQVGGHSFYVIGVAPPGFRGSLLPLSADLWVPLSAYAERHPAVRERQEKRESRFLMMAGRLEPGFTAGQGEAALNTIDQQLEREHPETPAPRASTRPERRLSLLPMNGIFLPPLRRVATVATTLLLSVAAVLLLIACLNVANMLLARGLSRTREIAVRAALGASHGRLLRQLLTESVILALLGGASGLVVAQGGGQLLAALRTPTPAPWQFSADARLDGRVLLFGFVVALATSLVFGLAPALQSLKVDIRSRLTGGASTARSARGGHLMGHILVAAQVAVSVVVLVATGLLLGSLRHLHSVPPGFETEGEDPTPYLYRPFTSGGIATLLLFRTVDEPRLFLTTVAGELRRLDPTLSGEQIRTLPQHLDIALWPTRTGLSFLGAFGALGLLLNAVGIYGVMSWSVAERSHEIGVRMALGARARQVAALVIQRGLLLTAVGTAVGLGLALAASRLLSGLLSGVTPSDPATYAVVVLTVAAVALVACVLPSRRAARVDPMAMLRQD